MGFRAGAGRLLVASACTLLAFGGGVVPASSATGGRIVVNTVSNENNNDGDCSLREAISSANTDSSYDHRTAGSGTDTISLRRGTYRLDSRLSVIHSLQIIGAGRRATVIDAEQSDRALTIDHTDLALRRLRVSGGKTQGDGGGILDDAGALTLVDTSVTANRTSGDGGGIAMTDGGTVRLTRSLVANNVAGKGGGGIAATGVPGGKAAAVSVVESTISGNEADVASGSTTGGGGIHLSRASVLSLIRSTVSGNRANSGGGISNESRAKVLNSTISGNSALGNGSRGGGIDNEGNALLTNVTFDANRAGSGGNLYLGTGSMSAKNTIVGPAADGGNCDGGQPTDDGGNLEQDPNGNPCGFAIAGLNLGPLSDNGGPTQTHALSAHSPAVDAGRATVCPRSDQRGVPRRGSSCDSGAYEFATCFGLLVRIVGTEGKNRLLGTPGPDVVLALGGDDRVSGRGGNDSICGGEGNDDLGGDEGADKLDGSAGKDVCDGGPGSDRFVACETRLGKP